MSVPLAVQALCSESPKHAGEEGSEGAGGVLLVFIAKPEFAFYRACVYR